MFEYIVFFFFGYQYSHTACGHGPFGRTNTPATFQEMMDEIFDGMDRILWYLDDILIHDGKSEVENQKIVVTSSPKVP